MKFKFISLNIWNGGKLFDNALKFLKKESPHILALQEVYESGDQSPTREFQGRLEFLRRELFNYYFFSPTHGVILPDGKSTDKGNAVLSRFPIIEWDTYFYVPYRDGLKEFAMTGTDFTHIPRSLQHVLINVNDKKLNVFNNHGIWGQDGQDNPQRLAMAETIREKIKGKSPLILCGDFNVNEGTQTIANIEKGLVNIFKNERKTSFNIKRKPRGTGYATAVVDFIFVSPDIKVLGHNSPEVDISDHLPLICVLQI